MTASSASPDVPDAGPSLVPDAGPSLVPDAGPSLAPDAVPRARRGDGSSRASGSAAPARPPAAYLEDGAVFTTSDARAAGLTPGVLRGPRFDAPSRGVRIAGEPTFVARCRAVALELAPDTAFSHVTALRMLGVEVPWQLEDDARIHVVSTRREDRGRRRGVVAHFTAHPLRIVRRDGLDVVAPEQVWLQLANRLPPDDLVVLGDAMTRRKSPVTTVAALAWIAGSTHKTRGVVRARDAALHLRAGTDSSQETRARLLLTQAGLPCPVVNARAYDARGRFLAMPDLSYPELKVAIEYDGDVHRTDPATWRRDVERRQRLEDAGWIVVTATADDVLREPARFVARVRAARRRATVRR